MFFSNISKKAEFLPLYHKVYLSPQPKLSSAAYKIPIINYFSNYIFSVCYSGLKFKVQKLK